MTDCIGRQSARDHFRTAVRDVISTLPATVRILDAGCGQGLPMLSWLNSTAIGVGLDISRPQLHRSRVNVPVAPLVQGDMRALPFRENSFEVITATASLTHVPDRNQRTVLEEFARVIQMGGQLLLVTNAGSCNAVSVQGANSTGAVDSTRNRVVAAGFSIIEATTTTGELGAEDGQLEQFLSAEYTG